MKIKIRTTLLIAVIGLVGSQLLKVAIENYHKVEIQLSLARAQDEILPPDPEANGSSGEFSTNSSDVASKATRVEHKITDVTVYADRAKITRAAKLTIKKGSKWVRFASLPEMLEQSSLKILKSESLAARISQILVQQTFEHKALTGNAGEKLAKLQTLYGRLINLTQQNSALIEVSTFINSISFGAPIPSSSYQSYIPFAAPIETLKSSVNAFGVQSKEIWSKTSVLENQIVNLQSEISVLENELSGLTNLSDRRWVTQVYCLLESDRDTVGDLKIEYMIQNANWHPIYDMRAQLNHESGKAAIKLVVAGMVEQKTGENWEKVNLTLSTLSPVPLYIPKLWRWALAEQRTESLPPPPPGAIAPGKFKENSAANEAAPAADEKLAAKEKDSAPVRSLKKVVAKQEEARPKNAPAPAVAQFSDGVDAPMSDLEGNERQAGGKAGASGFGARRDSYQALPKGKSAGNEVSGNSLFTLQPLEELYPNLATYSGQLAALTKAETRQVDLSAVRNSSESENGAFGGVRLTELRSPFPVDVGNESSPYKVPVHSQDFNADVSYFAVPKKDTRVFLKARTSNTTNRPILAGEAQVYMNGDLVSKTSLGTVESGSYFDIDLGVDRNIEIKRIVRKNAGDKGLLSTKHLTKVNVQIEIVNHHSFAVRMELADNLPVSPTEDITVTRKSIDPKVLDEKAMDGILRWNLSIPGNQKKIITFSYEVTHPENFLVSELN